MVWIFLSTIPLLVLTAVFYKNLSEGKLPFRTLWYQIEPILAYQKLKDYDRVFQLTDKILRNYNRAFSELYQIRGEIYQELGKEDLAKTEFEKSRFYNVNFNPEIQPS